MGRLDGKSAVITGAAKGIAGATADVFAAEGARLVLTDIDAEGLEVRCERLAAHGAEIAAVFGDVSIDGRGMFLTCKYAIEAMVTTGGGSIVCLSSISGMAGQSRQSTYGPAKFVATGLTKHLAVEWASRGIRVNAGGRRVRRRGAKPPGRGRPCR